MTETPQACEPGIAVVRKVHTNSAPTPVWEVGREGAKALSKGQGTPELVDWTVHLSREAGYAVGAEVRRRFRDC